MLSKCWGECLASDSLVQIEARRFSAASQGLIYKVPCSGEPVASMFAESWRQLSVKQGLAEQIVKMRQTPQAFGWA